jgi:hypothetical protein
VVTTAALPAVQSATKTISVTSLTKDVGGKRLQLLSDEPFQ